MPEAIRALTMPKWGLTMEEGTVAEWEAAEGDSFEAGDEVVFIETSKIAGPLEAPFAGVLTRIVAQTGEVLPVGALLAVVTDGDADAADIDAFVTEFQANFVPEESTDEEAAVEAMSVEVDGRKLSYVLNPSQGGTDATPVLLIHGFSGDANAWLFNTGELSQERPVYAIDLPGHGASTKDVGDGSLEVMTQSILAFLDALEIARVHLVAHSMGGAIALSIALDHPDRIASTSLIGGCGLGDSVNDTFIQGMISSQRRKEVKPFLQMIFADPELVSREMIDAMLKYKRIDGVPEALAKVAAAFFPGGVQTHQFRDRITDLQAPLLVIWGAQDAIVDPSGAQGLPETVSIHLLDNVGHIPQMEAAGDVNRLLLAHFEAN